MLQKLDQGAVEFFSFPIALFGEDGQPVTVTSASIAFKTGAGVVTRSGPVVNGKFRVLIAGPTAPANADAVTLPLGRTTYKITVIDVVERLVSDEGTIRVS